MAGRGSSCQPLFFLFTVLPAYLTTNQPNRRTDLSCVSVGTSTVVVKRSSTRNRKDSIFSRTQIYRPGLAPFRLRARNCQDALAIVFGVMRTVFRRYLIFLLFHVRSYWVRNYTTVHWSTLHYIHCTIVIHRLPYTTMHYTTRATPGKTTSEW